MSKVKNYIDGVKSIENLITISECRNLISKGNRIGFEEATVNSDNSQAVIKEIRNNYRVHIDDPGLAIKLYRRVFQYLPRTVDGWIVNGLNERFRFYRYEKAQYFKWHQDDSYVKEPGLESRYTFLIYLNEDYEGGETEFENFIVTPKTGMSVLFPHDLKHQARDIQTGVKYALRTDVMYRK